MYRDANRLIKDKEAGGGHQIHTSISTVNGANGTYNAFVGIDSAKHKEITLQDDLLAYNSGPQILIEPGIIPRGELIPNADIIDKPSITATNI